MDAMDLFHETSRSISNLLPRLRLHVGNQSLHMFLFLVRGFNGAAAQVPMLLMGMRILNWMVRAFPELCSRRHQARIESNRLGSDRRSHTRSEAQYLIEVALCTRHFRPWRRKGGLHDQHMHDPR